VAAVPVVAAVVAAVVVDLRACKHQDLIRREAEENFSQFTKILNLIIKSVS